MMRRVHIVSLLQSAMPRARAASFTAVTIATLSFLLSFSLLWGAFSYRLISQEGEVRIVQNGVLLERPIETFLEVTAVTKDRSAIVARVESRAFGEPLSIFMRVPDMFLFTKRALTYSGEGVAIGVAEPNILSREELVPGMKGRAVVRVEQDGSFSILSLRIGDTLPVLYNGQRADII